MDIAKRTVKRTVKKTVNDAADELMGIEDDEKIKRPKKKKKKILR